LAADCAVAMAVVATVTVLVAAVAAAAAMLVGRAEPPEAVVQVGAAAQE